MDDAVVFARLMRASANFGFAVLSLFDAQKGGRTPERAMMSLLNAKRWLGNAEAIITDTDLRMISDGTEAYVRAYTLCTALHRAIHVECERRMAQLRGVEAEQLLAHLGRPVTQEALAQITGMPEWAMFPKRDEAEPEGDSDG